MKLQGNFLCYFILRRSILLVAIFAALWAAAAVLAPLVGPQLIEAAYADRALPILGWISQHRDTIPVQFYLERWRTISDAVPLAGILHVGVIAFLLTIGRRDRSPGSNAVSADYGDDAILIGFSGVFIIWTLITWYHQDYVAYLYEWNQILAGGVPWDLDGFWINTYGPLFNVLALPASIHPLLPKLLIAFCYLMFTVWFVKYFAPRQQLVLRSWAVMLLWLFNPFPWIEIGYFGHFDVLMGIASVAAAHSLTRGRDVAAAFWLALGTLVKFLPVVILPFLALEGRRVRFAACSVFFVLTGFALSFLIWGPSTFTPIAFAATRQSASSIYDFFTRSPFSPLLLVTDRPNVDWLAMPCLAASGLTVFTWCAIRRVEPVLASVLAILTTLAFYRIGYMQYQTVLLMVGAYWATLNWEHLKDNVVLVRLLVAYCIYFAVVDSAYVVQAVPYGITFGLLNFPVEITLLAVLLRFSARNRSVISRSTA